MLYFGMIKTFLLILFLSLPILPGCRDYLNDIEYDKSPILVINSQNYNVNDTIVVDLTNRSKSTIYSTEILSFVEVKQNAGWVIYADYVCSTCSEMSILKDETVSFKGKIFTEAGTYRCVSLYAKSAGLPADSKSKVYSAEFTVTN
jgi:hypothetical protein